MSLRGVVISLSLFPVLTAGGFAQDAQPVYRNPKLTAEERAADLVKRMTLEEKVDQLAGGRRRARNSSDREQQQVFEELGKLYRENSQVSPREAAEARNKAQHYLMEKTRLGIPAIFQGEALHGFMANGSTSFPQVLGLASTWDPELVQQAFTAAADEMASAGVNQAFTPVLDLGRDPRWGRTEETYGEDPYLVSRMGVAAVTGLQGNKATPDANHVYATLKHFAVHSQPEAGANVAPANYSERTVREYFLPPFESGVRDANVRAVMPSYNELDGIPNHSNSWLLRNILRGEFGFQGIVVSDYFAIEQLITIHHVAANCEQAAKLAITAGVDVELPYLRCYKTLPALVRNGQISESLINEAVARVLRAKFQLGLFERPYADEQEAVQDASTAQNRELALQAARESITLLKNDKDLLPLDLTKIKRIAVIGPNAGDPHLGGYSGMPRHAISIREGIQNKVAGKAEVVYAEGCRITESKPVWEEDHVVPADPQLDQPRMSEAVAMLSTADVGVVVVGENEQTSREAWSSTHLGDRDNLDLLGRQDDLVSRLLATGKPVVVILLHGRPNSINFIKEHVPAILDGWYLGQEGGAALADVVFGDYNPAGRLPITVPRSVGQLPDYYYQKPSARRPYLFTDNSPLFPFGYGLSYTKFNYDNLRVEPHSIAANGTAKVSVDVTNTGSRAGDEVVQLYIREEVSSVTRPIKELRGFERVPIKPGETRTVTFQVGPEELRFYNREMKPVVEPGTFKIMVGPNSADLTSVSLEVK